VLKKDDYIERLLKLVKSICVNCAHYKNEEATLGKIGNLRGHWRQLNLDGYCESFYSYHNLGEHDN